MSRIKIRKHRGWYPRIKKAATLREQQLGTSGQYSNVVAALQALSTVLPAAQLKPVRLQLRCCTSFTYSATVLRSLISRYNTIKVSSLRPLSCIANN